MKIIKHLNIIWLYSYYIKLKYIANTSNGKITKIKNKKYFFNKKNRLKYLSEFKLKKYLKKHPYSKIN